MTTKAQREAAEAKAAAEAQEEADRAVAAAKAAADAAGDDEAPVGSGEDTRSVTREEWDAYGKSAFDEGFEAGYRAKSAEVISESEGDVTQLSPIETARETANAWWCGKCGNSQPFSYTVCIKCKTPALFVVDQRKKFGDAPSA